MKWNKVNKLIINGKKLLRNKSLSVKKNAPAIATGVSIFCWGSALVLMGLEAPKAHKIWAEKKERDPEASKLELAAAVAPVLWKPVALAAVGAGGEIISLKMMNARVLAATSLATMAMNDRNAIYSAAKDIVGDEKAEEIRNKAAENVGNKKHSVGKDIKDYSNDISGDQEIRKVVFGLTGAEFNSSPAEIRKNMADAAATLSTDDEISVSDIEYYLEAPRSKLGENLVYTFAGFVGRSTSKAYDKAVEQLRYDLIPIEDDFGKLGWRMEMVYLPDKYCKGY